VPPRVARRKVGEKEGEILVRAMGDGNGILKMPKGEIENGN
jgi:hypothetical protein